MILCFVTSPIFSSAQQNTIVSEMRNSVTTPKLVQSEEVSLSWDDGIFNHSVGLTQGGVFTTAIRFDADTISYYNYFQVTKINLYIADLPSTACILVWQGENVSNLSEKINQSFTPLANSWNEIVFDEPYYINSSDELWFGVKFQTDAGINPGGTDTLTNAPGNGNLVKIGDSEWTTLATYHVNGDWNIQATIEECAVKKYPVTFNVNMTGATFGAENEAFDPTDHQVFVSGSFNNWLMPGTDESYRLDLIYDEVGAGELPTTLTESWEGKADFATLFIPWLTIMENTDNTWSFNDFNFPLEGTPFAFMVFNPSSTNPAVDVSYPAKSGEKYLIAVQSQTPNDSKWLISRQLMGTSTSALNFWARSMSNVFGEERFQVLVSTSEPTPENFVKISEGDYLLAPAEWTNFEFDLSQLDGQAFYFAIRYVSEDALMLMIDDIEVTGERPLPDVLIYTTTLNIDEGQTDYKYYVVKDIPTADYAELLENESRTRVIASSTIFNDIWGMQTGDNSTLADASEIMAYPNPASSRIYVEYSKGIEEIKIFDLTGRMVHQCHLNNSLSANISVNDLSNGIYFLQLSTQDGLLVKRIVVKR